MCAGQLEQDDEGVEWEAVQRETEAGPSQAPEPHAEGLSRGGCGHHAAGDAPQAGKEEEGVLVMPYLVTIEKLLLRT